MDHSPVEPIQLKRNNENRENRKSYHRTNVYTIMLVGKLMARETEARPEQVKKKKNRRMRKRRRKKRGGAGGGGGG